MVAVANEALTKRLANRLPGYTRSAVIWRAVVVAGYFALAIVIGIAYGGRGLAILSFFYFWAGAWFVFLLAWDWAARAAGRWNFRRLDTARSGREGNGSHPDEGALEASEDLEVAPERDAPPAADAKRREPVPAL